MEAQTKERNKRKRDRSESCRYLSPIDASRQPSKPVEAGLINQTKPRIPEHADGKVAGMFSLLVSTCFDMIFFFFLGVGKGSGSVYKYNVYPSQCVLPLGVGVRCLMVVICGSEFTGGFGAAGNSGLLRGLSTHSGLEQPRKSARRARRPCGHSRPGTEDPGPGIRLVLTWGLRVGRGRGAAGGGRRPAVLLGSEARRTGCESSSLRRSPLRNRRPAAVARMVHRQVWGCEGTLGCWGRSACEVGRGTDPIWPCRGGP